MTNTNPWTAIKQRQISQTQRAEEERKAEARQREWNARWQAAMRQLAPASLKALTTHLRPHGIGLWLDYRDVILARVGWIIDHDLWPGYERANSHHYQVATLQLLQHAFLNLRTELTADLKAMDATKSRPAIADTLDDFRRGFESWCDGRFSLPTPFLSQTELAAALRRRLPGYGKSGICAKVARQELTIKDQTRIADDGKTIYGTYLHREPATQREILQHVVAWMREKSPIGSSFSSGLWTSDSTDKGA